MISLSEALEEIKVLSNVSVPIHVKNDLSDLWRCGKDIENVSKCVLKKARDQNHLLLLVVIVWFCSCMVFLWLPMKIKIKTEVSMFIWFGHANLFSLMRFSSGREAKLSADSIPPMDCATSCWVAKVVRSVALRWRFITVTCQCFTTSRTACD